MGTSLFALRHHRKAHRRDRLHSRPLPQPVRPIDQAASNASQRASRLRNFSGGSDGSIADIGHLRTECTARAVLSPHSSIGVTSQTPPRGALFSRERLPELTDSLPAALHGPEAAAQTKGNLGRVVTCEQLSRDCAQIVTW